MASNQPGEDLYRDNQYPRTAVLLLVCLFLLEPIHAFLPRSVGVPIPNRFLAASKSSPAIFGTTRSADNDDNGNINEPKDDPEWTFMDTARIHVKGGDGGNRCTAPSFKFKKRRRGDKGNHGGESQDAGPSFGGRGGTGGSVYLVCDDAVSTLVPMRHQVHFKAGKGDNGLGNNRAGPKGGDVFVKTPPGTLVRELQSRRVVRELNEVGETLLLARGGPGASKLSDKGEKGEEKWLSVELRLVADIGFVGMPNVGRSTLLAAMSNAMPKIADYKFTTTGPNLGICNLLGDGDDNDQENDANSKGIVLCDLPGLVEGAAQGAGMGAAFLRHVQFCPALLHVVDGTSEDPVRDFDALRRELHAVDGRLARKPQVVVLNKSDAIPGETAELLVKALMRKAGHSRVLPVSSATRENVQELVRQLHVVTRETAS